MERQSVSAYFQLAIGPRESPVERDGLRDFSFVEARNTYVHGNGKIEKPTGKPIDLYAGRFNQKLPAHLQIGNLSAGDYDVEAKLGPTKLPGCQSILAKNFPFAQRTLSNDNRLQTNQKVRFHCKVNKYVIQPLL